MLNSRKMYRELAYYKSIENNFKFILVKSFYKAFDSVVFLFKNIAA